MKTERRAVIDIGTNSVKLLVADVRGERIDPILECSEQTRLGSGFYATHRLQPKAIQATAATAGNLVHTAKKEGTSTIRIIATSAARDALNRNELLEAVFLSTGLHAEVISGEQEAAWAFRGISSDERFDGQPLLLMDAGGGSTQLIYGENGHYKASHSFQLGAVRLLDQMHLHDPPHQDELARCRNWLDNFVQNTMKTGLMEHIPTGIHTRHLVGTGGSSSLLAAMELKLQKFDRAKIESITLGIAQIQQRVEQLWSMSLEERKTIPGIQPEKADVILLGAAIHEAVMIGFHLTDLRISTRGFRFAALL